MQDAEKIEILDSKIRVPLRQNSKLHNNIEIGYDSSTVLENTVEYDLIKRLLYLERFRISKSRYHLVLEENFATSKNTTFIDIEIKNGRET